MRSAIATVLGAESGDHPLSEQLCRQLPSAQQLRASAVEDPGARFFLASLEAAYLVAAADGVDGPERAALGELVGAITGLDLQPEVLADHFATFDAAAKASSRAARVEGVAARLPDFVEREQALGFAAIVAMADQHFARKEARALIELGEAFGFSVGEVQALLDSLVGSIRQALPK
jgi:tellurite resistance protein